MRRIAIAALLLPGLAFAQAPPLAELFEPGGVLQDRNGDGFIDFIDARIVTGENPSAATIAAASDVAARLGFETMAMNLPLTEESGTVAVAVGAGALGAIDVDLSVLAPEQGLVTTRAVDGRLWIVLAGADDAGTRAAAAYFAGRFPHVWDPEGETLGESVTELIVTTEGIVRPEASEPEPDGPTPARPGSGPKRDLDLSNLFTPDGLLGDSDDNLIPDRIDTVLSPAGSYAGTIDLAARLGLEAAGLSIPLVKLPDAIEEAEDEPTLVLIGDHPLLEEAPELAPGEGVIHVIPESFGPKGSVVIRGGDEAGVERALVQVSERFPHLWERGKDRTTLDDVEMDLWRFFSGRSPAGQAAMALYKLDELIEKLADKDLASVDVTVSLEKPEPAFELAVREEVPRFGAASFDVTLDDRDVRNAATIFEESFEIDSEVDEFWRLFRDRILPRARKNRTFAIEARLSEPPEVRRQIEDQVWKELLDEGIRDSQIRILSAYKQGYSWLYEAVRPALGDRRVGEITIRVARYTPPNEWPQQAMHTPLRWLHEVFPIDEILARELGMDPERIHFEMAPENAAPYEVLATAPDGRQLYRGTFAPKVVLRPYLDRFRDYEMVNVTTGWVTATVGDETVLDQRIATDPERFWSHFQERTLSQIYDYVMDRHEGKPRGDGKDAPYFGELTVEVEMSEPHYLLDLDKEIISSLDALHEDIYFTTHMFFRVFGRNARGEELTYPGRVIPIMTPKADGESGSAKIRFTGFATSRPAVVVQYEETNGERGEERLDIPKIEMDRPKALAAWMRAGEEGLERLHVRVKVDTERDERETLLERARYEEVDETILSAEQVVATLERLGQLRARGLYPDALAYHDLKELRVAAGWEHEVDPETELLATLEPNGRPAPFPDIGRYAYTSTEPGIVQWDTPIPPSEAYGILSRMAQYDEATVYKMGESYLGKDVWAMDLMPPIEASHFSHAKATTLKPTVIYSARQHANEVSSTSHVLKLAELLLTDHEERKKLDKVNVVIHPITNPDGAQLAYDLYRETPELILHAGYYASLGADVTTDSRKPMPIYPEATVRPRLWSTWLPDIFLNPHGYPSHQLVQLFSEYTGLVRRGRETERNWSMNKGWFIPSFDYIDDARHPRHKEAAFRIRDYITRAINAAEDVHAMNQRNYDRYRRYGGQFHDEVFKLPMVDDVMIHTAIKGSRAPRPGSDRGYNPKVTIWSGSTEAPDETAHGDWMKLVATAGLQWDKAILQYLVDGDHEVDRKSSTFWKGVSWSMDRPRPPKPEEEDASPP